MKTQSSILTTPCHKTMAGSLRTACSTRLLSLLLVLTLPVAVQAQFDYADNGDGTATITKYTGSGGAVNIPRTINGLSVVSIGDWAFTGCTSLTSATVPNGVTSIGYAAFDGCTSLSSIVMPSSVNYIGNWAFQACHSLASVTIPSSVTSIGGAVFYQCTGLTNVMIPNSVTIVREWAFFQCTSLTNITIPSSVISIVDYAFNSCVSLKAVNFQGNAPSLGWSVFGGDNNAIVYYLPWTTGWGWTFGGLPTVFGAFISGLYSTGVNNDGTLATLGTVDGHYALVSVPSGSTGTAWMVAPFPGWWSGSTDANWLSPSLGSGGIGYSADAGQYDYRLVFSMVDARGHPLDPTTATITGNWTADDQVRLLLNGVPMATNNTTLASLGSFAVSSGFRHGTNTLDFLVINTPFAGGNPSGLLVSDLAGSAGFSGPFPATASTVLAYGFVVAANITDSGYGYTNTPLVRLIGGGGSGAQAVAVVSNGVVVAVNVLDAGYGYTNAPLVVIEPPFIPNPVLSIAPMSFLSFFNLTLGGNYQLQQSVAWYWTNLPLSFTATDTIYTQMVAGVVGSGDYRLALNPAPAQAFATAQVVNGFVVGATMTSGGSSYVTSPAVTIVGGGGTNATAVSHISGGVVTSISITSAGIGYTNTPTLEVAQPPAVAVSPTVLPVMRVDSANLAPYDNYQIQFEPDLGGTWGNWNGGLFSPTAVTNSQYLFITNGVGFFRLQYVP